MATTKRTVEEAQNYIEDTIKIWNIEGKTHKIISLAAIAEKWRPKGGGPAAKMNVIKKNINSLELMAKRNASVGIDNTFLEEEILELNRLYAKMQDEYIPSERKTK